MAGDFGSFRPRGLEGIAQGMELGLAPFRERRKAEAEDLANALTRMKMEYMPQDYQAQIGLRQAQTEKARQEAAQQKMMMDYLSGQLRGGAQGGAEGSMPMSGGSDLATAALRKMFNLPIETPEEKYARGIKQFQEQQKIKEEGELEKNFASKIREVLPHLKRLQEIDVPYQGLGGRIARFSPDKQRDYESEVTAVVEPIFTISKLAKTDTTYKDVKKKYAKGEGESDPHYRRRIGREILDLAKLYKEKTGKDLPDELMMLVPKEEDVAIQRAVKRPLPRLSQKNSTNKLDAADPLGLR